MTTHTIAFALEEDCLAVHNPTGSSTHITTLRDRMNLTTFGTNDSLVGIWVTLIGDKTKDEPLTVWAPFKIEPTVLTIPFTTVCYLRNLLGLQINHLQFDTIFDEGQLLAVRTVFGTLTLHLREVGLTIQLQFGQFRENAFLLNQCSIGKVQVFVSYDAGCIELPVAISF